MCGALAVLFRIHYEVTGQSKRSGQDMRS
jgi:hypothetical protein